MLRQLLHSSALFAIALLLTLPGCAPVQQNLGHDLIEKGEYARAVRPLKMAIAEDYTDARAIRDMGIAMYHTGKLTLAQGFLRLALSRLPKDVAAHYYLGVVYEEQGRIDQALQQYTRYAELNPRGSLRKEVEGRRQVLLRRQMAAQIKAMIEQESALGAGTAPENSVAVLYFTNLSSDPQYLPLQKGLAEMIITDLSQVQALQVVERARMQLLVDEMGLGMSGLVDESSAPRLGKLLSAGRIVQGTLSGTELKTLRIEAALATLAANTSVPAEKVSGPLEEFYQLEKDVVFSLVDALGLQLSRSEREAIQRIPTKNLNAFMAWCRGLDDEDRGQWQSASDQYRAAVAADPGFEAAQQGVDRSEAVAAWSPKPAVLPPSQLAAAGRREERGGMTQTQRAAEPAAIPEAASPTATLDMLSRTASQVTPGFFPGPESRKPTTEGGGVSIGGSMPIDIRIHLPVKP